MGVNFLFSRVGWTLLNIFLCREENKGVLWGIAREYPRSPYSGVKTGVPEEYNQGVPEEY